MMPPKGKQAISLYYKQTKNCFPEFDKGLFEYEYQNHIIDMLGKIYSFKGKWVAEQMAVLKIVVKDKQLLNAAATLSTRGSYGSREEGEKYNFVNQTLGSIAWTAEDALDIPVIADTTAGGYDLELDFSSLPAFELSLGRYGLGIEKVDGYEVKKLDVVFY